MPRIIFQIALRRRSAPYKHSSQKEGEGVVRREYVWRTQQQEQDPQDLRFKLCKKSIIAHLESVQTVSISLSFSPEFLLLLLLFRPSRNTVVYNLKRRWRRMCVPPSHIGKPGRDVLFIFPCVWLVCERTKKLTDAGAFCEEKRRKIHPAQRELRIVLLFFCVTDSLCVYLLLLFFLSYF